MKDGWLQPYAGLLLICGLCGLFIGGIRAAKLAKPGQPLRVILIDAAGSGFVSFLTGVFSVEYFNPARPMLAIGLAGLTGYMGLTVMDVGSAYLTARAKRLLGETSTPPEKLP